MRAIYAFGLLLVVAASAASAARFVPSAEPERVPVRPTIAVKADLVPAAAPRMQSFEVRQAPVPLRWGYKHAAVAVPEDKGPSIADLANQATVDQPASDQGSTMALTADGGGASAASAKAAIEADGYKGVRALAQGPDGRWQARALRGATEITVSVSADGSVSAD